MLSETYNENNDLYNTLTEDSISSSNNKSNNENNYNENDNDYSENSNETDNSMQDAEENKEKITKKAKKHQVIIFLLSTFCVGILTKDTLGNLMGFTFIVWILNIFFGFMQNLPLTWSKILFCITTFIYITIYIFIYIPYKSIKDLKCYGDVFVNIIILIELEISILILIITEGNITKNANYIIAFCLGLLNILINLTSLIWRKFTLKHDFFDKHIFFEK